MPSGITRREALVRAGGIAAAASAVLTPAAAIAAGDEVGPAVKKGRLRQSVCRWCYGSIQLPDLCKAAKSMGLSAVDLLKEEEWPVARDHGLTCSMAFAGGGWIDKGLNDKANHDGIVKGLEDGMPKAAAAGLKKVISFFGNRLPGQTDQEAIDNCVACLSRVKRAAEQTGITICVELLNSKVDHKGYVGDRTPFGVAVMKGVDSPNVKLLYDIYHMQIMEGDIIRTIRDNFPYIAHFHTGGVPGRNELDDTQELQWATVSKAIVDAGFEGFYAHEFIPKRVALASLREAVVLCDV